jgi:hypothetical protein
MSKDLLATIGLMLFLLGFYFIYWPLCLVVGGLLITSYCVLVIWIQSKQDNDDGNN